MSKYSIIDSTIQKILFVTSRYVAVKCWCGGSQHACMQGIKNVSKREFKKSGKWQLNLSFTKLKIYFYKKWQVRIMVFEVLLYNII